MSNFESTLKAQPVVFASSLGWLIDSSSREEVKSEGLQILAQIIGIMKSGFIQKFRCLMRNNTTRQYLVHSCLIIYFWGARLNGDNKEPLKWVLSTQTQTYFYFMWYPKSKWGRLAEQLKLV